MSDDSIELTDEQIRLFANERIQWDRSESTPYTHQAKLSRNLLEVKKELREHMWWERTSVELQRQRDRLDAALREIAQEVASVGCEGADDAICIETTRAKEDWCPYCRIGTIIRDAQSTSKANDP